MYLYFVSEENRAYYQSPMFGRLLTYAQQNFRSVHIRQNSGKRSFLIDNVPTASAALKILSDTLALNPS